MSRSPPILHAVTNDSVLELPDFSERARALAIGPSVALHLRGTRLSGRNLVALARRLQELCAPVPILINDRVDAARVSGAHGVHLPAAGLPVAAARSILGRDVWVGRSTHSADEALRAADQGADYVFLGPVWRTDSHPEREPIGLAAISAVTRIPVIAIGGVTPRRVQQAIEAGAHGVAAISALWYAEDPRAVAQSMLLSFES
ncbi:MAG: thiamine phosphate synthase [Gemmatimonadota bacterium]|nr:MAG: thiamine phosphate synthase [Gemmatimonadota bacterium]